MAGELKALRDAFMQCKDTKSSFSEVTRCTVAALTIAHDAIMASPNAKSILKCLPAEKDRTAYLLDLAEIAEVGSFDLEDIMKAAPLECARVGSEGTSIDRIDLKNGFTYLVKHRGNVSDPIADAAAFTAPQLIAKVLGEDLPHFVWSNPRKGRFAMSWLPHKESYNRSFNQYQPHEMVTTLIFETLIGDPDRHGANVVTLRNAILGHIDFGARFAGLEHSPSSSISEGLLRSINSNPSLFSREYPEFKVALEEGIQRWNLNWRQVLSRIDTSLTTPSNLRHVDKMLNELAEKLGINVRAPGTGSFQYFEPVVHEVKVPPPGKRANPVQLAALAKVSANVRQVLEEAKELITLGNASGVFVGDVAWNGFMSEVRTDENTVGKAEMNVALAGSAVMPDLVENTTDMYGHIERELRRELAKFKNKVSGKLPIAQVPLVPQRPADQIVGRRKELADAINEVQNALYEGRELLEQIAKNPLAFGGILAIPARDFREIMLVVAPDILSQFNEVIIRPSPPSNDDVLEARDLAMMIHARRVALLNAMAAQPPPIAPVVPPPAMPTLANVRVREQLQFAIDKLQAARLGARDIDQNEVARIAPEFLVMFQDEIAIANNHLMNANALHAFPQAQVSDVLDMVELLERADLELRDISRRILIRLKEAKQREALPPPQRRKLMTIDITHQPRLLQGGIIKLEKAISLLQDAIRQGLAGHGVDTALASASQLNVEMKGLRRMLPRRGMSLEMERLQGLPPRLGIPADRLDAILRRVDEEVNIIEGLLPRGNVMPSPRAAMGRRLFPTVPLLEIRECANRFNRQQLVQLALQHNLPTDGNKIELCARLVAAGAVPAA